MGSLIRIVLILSILSGNDEARDRNKQDGGDRRREYRVIGSSKWHRTRKAHTQVPRNVRHSWATAMVVWRPY